MERIIAVYQAPDGPRAAYLKPDALPTPALAKDLATVWARIASFNPSAVPVLRSAIVEFCRVMGMQVGFEGDRHTIGDVRLRHIEAWEAALLTRQAEQPRSDAPYRMAVQLYALLRYIEDEEPGTLQERVNARIRLQTRVSHIRNEPLPDFSDDELTRIKAAVRKITRPNGEWARYPDADVLVGFHIALIISTGEPPEVLRALTMDDITVASTAPESAGMSTAEIAAAGLTTSYTVTLRKNRAHRVDEVTWDRDRHPTTLRYLDALITCTEPLRTGQERHLWMTIGRRRDRWRRPLPWRSVSLKSWIREHVEGLVSEPYDFRRFRKAAISADAIAGAPRYLRTQRRHTRDTFFESYTNSPSLRDGAGELLVTSISELYERATGPVIRTEQGVYQLDVETGNVSACASDTPPTHQGALAGCKDPQNSPHAPRGDICPMSLAGTCFTCPNAVITAEHLPALVLVNRVSAPDAATDAELWSGVWGDIYEATTTVLTMFPAALVEQATLHADDVLVDLGLRHELRGPDGEQG